MAKDNTEKDTGIYREIALGQIPRILGLGDRKKYSVTSGCFDRYYWHYKITDFPNARFQEAALLLALIYKKEFMGNIFYNKPAVLDWALQAVSFWLKIQRGNGSFDEVYPRENSFIATAFSAAAATEAVLLLDKDILPSRKLIKTGDWLAKNNNEDVGNQMAASALALYNIFLITSLEKYKIASEEKIKKILASQSGEGFFPEYGSYDVGYMSICVSYLAQYARKNQSPELDNALVRAASFIESKVRPDGSYDWAEMSRQTQYIYPFGLGLIKSGVLDSHVRGLSDGAVLNPAWMDDRFCLPLTIDYLRTAMEC
ncbi:MAG: hypothetical protein COZ72_00500 [Elusimicrobia bacterium CG_4_8_14_3_um_filter_50_9]|nr:MAG: hypothetical protein COZ72_00500 [Elusimicrobia bacterium CG_4_8_14_3_um_filter_50_9]